MQILIAILMSFVSLTDIHPFWSVQHDTVICQNADSERHIVTNSGYETVICTWEKDIDKTIVFVIPPKDVSYSVYCSVLDNITLFCPMPYFVDSDREVKL